MDDKTITELAMRHFAEHGPTRGDALLEEARRARRAAERQAMNDPEVQAFLRLKSSPTY